MQTVAEVLRIYGSNIYYSLLIQSFVVSPLYFFRYNTGFGGALTTTGTLAVVGFYVQGRVGVTYGFVTAGSSFGLLAFSPIFTLLIDMYSWRGAMLITSSLLAHQCVVGALFRQTLSEATAKRAKTPHNIIKSKEICERELNSSSEVHFMEPIINWTFGFALLGCPFTEVPRRRQSIQMIRSQIRKSSIQVTNDIKRSDTVAIFKNIRLLNFNISMFLRGFAYYGASVNFVALCVDIDISKVDAAFLLSLMGICGVAARLSHGFLIDKELVTPLHFQIVTQQVAGFSCIFIGLYCNFATLCVYVTLFGVCSGIFFATTTNSIRHIVDAHLVKGGIGIAMTVACAGGLLGVPASGKIFDVTKSYTTSYYISGCLFLVSSILHCMDHLLVSYQRRRREMTCGTLKDRTEFECQGISLPKASKV